MLSTPPSPDELLGDLFDDVQLSGIFADSKTFVDCVPKQEPAALLALYEAKNASPDFDLMAFVREHFTFPTAAGSDYVSDTSVSTSEHIDRLWDWLTRAADSKPDDYDSRVPLPHRYVVPGGRFREIFYWDTYFTMLGLAESGKTDPSHIDLIRGMVENFAHLIDKFGFIPNGNRTYFLSRSQPPFFGLMVNLLADSNGTSQEKSSVLVDYLPQLQREFKFWHKGANELTSEKRFVQRMVQLPAGGQLNRYWDDTPTPRPEAYRQEIELTEKTDPLGITPETLYTNIRAACESGWDFSSRWFSDQQTMATIHTIDIVPVDLNCLLYHLETTLRDACAQAGMTREANWYSTLATVRAQQIQTTFWNDETGFFHDFDAVANQQTPMLTLAGVFPLFVNLATPRQAARIHERLKADFLQPGGWVTTLQQSSEQWDWPNGWAPLQWIVYQGLTNYGFTETACLGRDRWLVLNDNVFKATGKMMEKYNVVDASLTTGGGEYANQDGFGWTNGVYVRLMADKVKEIT
ncbi:alpha,alpha-trehalase TreF [Spirosoma utsteinense]|uniref:Alpha,alpha-trehalase n=1 Tax=Spirosoma utsteinense TaxID=2585773 RepID=A0ABR6W2X1_9BACT|nr:alpha,alpha-trehalase TreF [Spirosoma utsteinense]MBC3784252.1 alpha,alpha-trehalase [Spirosoma utsteinense]MBC3790951.1 alpha,alpha-trehalase [Spirosoma utsteinense]